MHNYKSHRAILWVSLYGLCLTLLSCSTDGGTDSDNEFSEDRTDSLGSERDVTSDIAVSVITARSEDLLERQVQQTIPCPGGGSRTTNEDGSITFEGCVLLPGLMLDGTAKITPQGGDTQGGRIELDGITGTTQDGTEFFVDGVIEEIENEDGSLSFEIDITSVTESDGYVDTFNAQGSVTVEEDGTMHGTLTTDVNDLDTNLPPSDCDFEGHNIFLELESVMDNACQERDQEQDERCPAGEVCIAPGAGACCVEGSCDIQFAESCEGIPGASYTEGSSCDEVQCEAEQPDADDIVVYYTGNVCCWGAPWLLIGTRSLFESEQLASSFSGGGIDPELLVVKIELQGGFTSQEEAAQWLCPQIVSRFNHYWCGSNYVQMDGANWWMSAACDLSDVPYVEADAVPESDLCE